jgi:hypothetical protein
MHFPCHPSSPSIFNLCLIHNLPAPSPPEHEESDNNIILFVLPSFIHAGHICLMIHKGLWIYMWLDNKSTVTDYKSDQLKQCSLKPWSQYQTIPIVLKNKMDYFTPLSRPSDATPLPESSPNSSAWHVGGTVHPSSFLFSQTPASVVKQSLRCVLEGSGNL